MICPSCGTQNEEQAKFCASCGTRLLEPAAPAPGGTGFAAVPPPPAWGQIQSAPPPPPAPAWSQPQPASPPPPPPPAPPFGAQAGAPQQYGAPAYVPPPYAAPGYAAPAAKSNTTTFAGLIALLGGAAAIGSAWLPWAATSSGDSLLRPADITAAGGDLANGYYLAGAGAIVAVVGVLLLIGLAKSSGLRMVLALVAVVGGVAILVVEFSAYNHVNDMITYYGASQVKLGNALYAGAAAGVAGIVGGLLGIVPKG